MKTSFTSLFITIAIVITSGCSTTPKVVKTYDAPKIYTLGQEPQKVEYENGGKIWSENAKREQADRLEHQRKMKLLEYMAAEQNFAATNGVNIVPVIQSPPPSEPTARPQSGLQYDYDQRNGAPRLRPVGTSAGLRSGWGTYPDQSFRGQMSLLGSGLQAFLLPHSQAGRERGVVTSYYSYSSSAPAARVTATVGASGRINLGGQPRLTQKALTHARSINPNFDRDRRVGVGGRTYAADISVVGAGVFRSAGTLSRPRLR